MMPCLLVRGRQATNNAIFRNKYETNNYARKQIWKDYTDELINKNMAIKQEEEKIEGTNYDIIRVKGQNQVFFVGMATCVCELPIDENIRKNYTTWGEQ